MAPLTNEELNTIKNSVKSKIEAAVGSNQSFWDISRNQDDNIGFTHKLFTHPVTDPANQTDIQFQYFDFPEITRGSSDRFVLTGNLFLGPVSTDPVDHCEAQ